jgi:cell division septum initiation protein DivIVA
MEKTLQNSLLTAERVAEEAHDRAKLEAETIIEDARLRGERILGDSRERLRALSREVQGLHRQKDLFVQRLQSFLQAQSDLIDARKEELGVVDELNLQAEKLLVESDLPATEMAEEAPRTPDETDAPQPTEPARREVRAETAVAVEGRSTRDETPATTASPQKGFFETSERANGFFEVSADEGARR